MLLRARQAVLTRGSDGEKPVKITGTRLFCMSIVQIDRFWTKPSYYAVESKIFRFGLKIFNLFAPCWVEKKIFPPGPKHAFGFPSVTDDSGSKPDQKYARRKERQNYFRKNKLQFRTWRNKNS